MSVLYLGTDIEQLAGRLAANLDSAARAEDFFVPASIVVPHRSLGQWFRLWLARQQGIAINLRRQYLEEALWEMLKEVDPRPQDPAPEMLDGDHYRLLVLAVLQENQEPGLEFWRNYLQADGASRLFGRRLWHLADQLSALIRDYEYHRQNALIQHWLKGELGLDASQAHLERGQQAIFSAITRLPDGKRALLNDAVKRNFKTLPQYAMEVMEHYELNKLRFPTRPRRTVHLLGLSQISMLHAETLRWLGRFFDLRVYHVNALLGRLGTDQPQARDLERLASNVGPAADLPELLYIWARAGAESLFAMARLASEPKHFAIEMLSRNVVSQRDTVLSRLQTHLVLGKVPSEGLPHDASLQIVACPGRVREVETVYQSILDNLQKNPDLRQSDIAVLAADMEIYRPILQAVFERRERTIRYNLGDFSAAGVSVFGQALLGMLDLALDAFTRTRVCELLLNPCFLARLGIDRGQALAWLDWVQALDIYQGWNQVDKKERGYADSPLFGWELGLRRLRLGRIMETGRDDELELAPRFGPVVPFADLRSGDPEQVNVFCLAVEGLLPRLNQLRSFQGPARAWVERLEALMHDFLEIPEDRPEETQVRERLLAGLQKWLIHDHLGADPQKLSAGLVREMVVTLLQGIEGVRGQYSAGGVTMAALHPLKPMPFRIVYIVGLGEDIFPGSNALSGLDLRGLKPQPGDIRPADFNRYLLLETLLAVKDKIYLLYNNLDVQKDQVLHPSVPIQQLKRHLGEHILAAAPGLRCLSSDEPARFVETTIPLLPSDESYLKSDGKTPGDARAQFDETERVLAVTAACHSGGLILSAAQQAELDAKLRSRRTEYSLAGVALDQAERPPTLTIHNLARYLEHPAPEAVKYHLRLTDEEDDEGSDDEPFVSDIQTGNGLMRQTLNWYVLRAVQSGVEQARAEWQQHFQAAYDEWGLRGKVPEEAFGRVDRAMLEESLKERILGQFGLEQFLRKREKTFCGPVLIGESITPIGARQRFPALSLALPRTLPRLGDQPVRLVGAMPLAWRSDQRFEVLTWCFQSINSDKDIYRHILEPALFCMSLKAGTEALPGAGSTSSSAWLGERGLAVYVGLGDRIHECSYGPDHFTTESARDYLAELACDFLDPACFDNVPLRKIVGRYNLCRAIYTDDAELGTLPEEFQDQLTEVLEEDFNDFSSYSRRISDLVHLMGAMVPEDAFAKVRRRFRMFGSFDLLGKR